MEEKKNLENLAEMCVLKNAVEREEMARKLMIRHYELNGCDNCSGTNKNKPCYVKDD